MTYTTINSISSCTRAATTASKLEPFTFVENVVNSRIFFVQFSELNNFKREKKLEKMLFNSNGMQLNLLQTSKVVGGNNNCIQPITRCIIIWLFHFFLNEFQHVPIHWFHFKCLTYIAVFVWVFGVQ